MKVGFIGLGAMGLPMAKNVIKSGHELFTLMHRRREPVEELRLLGAKICQTAAETARMSEVVITVLPADAELRKVIFGTQGLAEGFSTGKVLIDMTTATPFVLQEAEKELAAKGVRILDAPVSGGTTGAAEGTLTIMAGGEKDLLEEYRPLLTCMARNIFHVGGVGQGKVVKIVNQLMAAVHVLVIGEAFALGVRSGSTPGVLNEVIKTSSGYSRMMDLRLAGFILDGTFEPGFKLNLMKKDLNLALELGQRLGIPLLLGSLAGQVMAAASASGGGEKDFSVAAQFLADLAQTKLSGFGQPKTA